MKKINALYDIDEDQTDKNRAAIWYRFTGNNNMIMLGTTMLLCRRGRRSVHYKLGAGWFTCTNESSLLLEN